MPQLGAGHPSVCRGGGRGLVLLRPGSSCRSWAATVHCQWPGQPPHQKQAEKTPDPPACPGPRAHVCSSPRDSACRDLRRWCCRWCLAPGVQGWAGVSPWPASQPAPSSEWCASDTLCPEASGQARRGVLDTRGPGGRSWPVPRDPGPGSVAKHLEASRPREGLLSSLHRMLLCPHWPRWLQGHSGPQRPRWGWGGSTRRAGEASARVSGTRPGRGGCDGSQSCRAALGP